MNWLNGRKTYLVSLALLVYGVAGLYLGYFSADRALELVLEGLGLGALRHGLKKLE